MYSIILKMESEKVGKGRFYKRIVEIDPSYVGVQQPSSAHFFLLRMAVRNI